MVPNFNPDLLNLDWVGFDLKYRVSACVLLVEDCTNGKFGLKSVGRYSNGFSVFSKGQIQNLLTLSRRDLIGCRFLAFEVCSRQANQAGQISEIWDTGVLRLILEILW